MGIGARATSLLTTWALAAGALGCAEATPKAAVVVPAERCADLAHQPDGACCPVGQAWVDTDKACAPVGPPECATVAVGAPSSCVPKWCWDTNGASGEISGRVCTTAELAAGAGCAAGEFAADSTSKCSPAGADPAALAQVPPDLPLPPLDAALFWAQGLCPPGFVADPGADVAPGALPACVPDPADCGNDLYGDAKLTDAIFVHADKGDDAAKGSREAPVASIGKALALAVPDATVAIAGGTYAESLVLTKPVTIRGRCAAQVVVNGLPGSPILKNGPIAVQHPIALKGLTLTGFGRGISIGAGAPPITIDRVWIHAVQSSAIMVQGAGSQVAVQSVVVSHILPIATLEFGMGIAVYKGGHATLNDVRISDCKDAGLFVSDSGTQVQADRVVIDGIDAQAKDQQFGHGVTVLAGAALKLSRARISGSRTAAVTVQDAGSVVTGAQWMIDGTRPQAKNGTEGRGIHLQGGALLQLTDARLSGNCDVGLAVAGAKTKAVVDHLTVDATLPQASDQKLGGGVLVTTGARLELADALLVANREVGLAVSGADASAVVRRARIAGTMPQQSTQTLGWGVAVTGGAKLDLQAAVIAGNREVGLLVAHTGSVVATRNVVVSGTQPQQPANTFGWGALAQDGGELRLVATSVDANSEEGIAVQGQDAALHAVGLLVSATMPRKTDGLQGRGISMQNGAIATLHGCRIDHNADFGVSMAQGQSVKMVGTVVSDTAARPSGQYGVGAYFSNLTGGVQVVACQVHGSHSAAVVVRFTAAQIANSVLRDTKPAKYQDNAGTGAVVQTFVALADGLVAENVGALTLSQSLVVGNARAAVLVKDVASGTIGASLVTGGFFGVAVGHGATPGIVHSAVHGSGQSISSGSFFVPLAPEVVAVTPAP